MLLWACMVANFECLTFAKKLGVDIPRLIEALGHGSGANWSLSRWGKSTGKWAEKDMDVALDLVDRVVVLFQGRVLAEGSKDKIKGDREVAAIYLGTNDA